MTNAIHSFVLRYRVWRARHGSKPDAKGSLQSVVVHRDDAHGIRPVPATATFKREVRVIDDNVPYYNRCVDGSCPPLYVLAILNRPSCLIARGLIRMKIAEQDRAVGDTWAEQNNIRVATHMMSEATSWIQEYKVTKP
jgi:hypothetical protein